MGAGPDGVRMEGKSCWERVVMVIVVGRVREIVLLEGVRERMLWCPYLTVLWSPTGTREMVTC